MIYLRRLLVPFSLLYYTGIQLRNKFYDWGWNKSYKVEVPVISVGNISTGGTGKTPVAEFLMAWCDAHGMRSAYLSRGYGRKTSGFRHVPPNDGTAADYGDEALQVAARFPHLPVAVCEDRVAGARKLIEIHQPDVIILDDGFQHRRIRRDLDIVVIDAARPPHKDLLLPAGNLREPRSALKRSQFLLFNKITASEQIAGLKQRYSAFPHAFSSLESMSLCSFDGEIQPVETLQGQGVIAFSGLGNNESFRNTLTAAGAEIIAFRPFSDHHPWNPSDFEKILAKFAAGPIISGKPGSWILVTSEKDFHRLRGLDWMKKYADFPFFYLKIGLKWLEGKEEFTDLLNRTLNRNERTHR